MEPRIVEVAAGTFAVEGSHTSFVLVLDGDEITLVDTGYPRDRRRIEAALGHLGRTLGDVRSLVLTHAHVDHLGSAERLRTRQKVPVHCHEAEVAQARGERIEMIATSELLRRAWRPRVLAFVANAVSKGALQVQHVGEVVPFGDGATLDVPGRPVAIHTPGHTSGHVAFHLPDRGVLLSGDALITVDVWDPADRGPQVIRAPFNHDHEQAVASLERLEAVPADAVVPGHGRPYRGSPAAAVAEARRRTP